MPYYAQSIILLWLSLVIINNYFAVGIGFQAESEQIITCYPKEECGLTVKISHFDKHGFDVTIDLLDSQNNNGKLHHEFSLILSAFILYAFK